MKNKGLGVRSLKVHNKSLLSKWVYRYNQEEHVLWKQIIHHKFGQWDFWGTSEVTETYGVRVWRTIRNFWVSLKNNSQIVVGTTPEPDTLAWGHHKYGMFSVNRLYSWGLRGSLEDSLNLGAQYGKVWHLPR